MTGEASAARPFPAPRARPASPAASRSLVSGRILPGAGLPQRLKLPHVAFNRTVGASAGPGGQPALVA
jgi:hypothetical protein